MGEPLDPACRDLIEKLLQLDPKKRLGAKDTDNDIWALMDHPFFEGIDFNTDLTNLGIENILNGTQNELNSQDQDQVAKNQSKGLVRERISSKQFAANLLQFGGTDEPILSGLLIKRNRYYMYQ